MAEAAVARALEQLQPELADARLRGRAEDGAGAEADRALADLHARGGRERTAAAADVGEQRPDLILGVGHELLDDRVEAALAGALPRGGELVERLRDHHLLAERAGEVLALDRLEQERWAQVELMQRLERVGL